MASSTASNIHLGDNITIKEFEIHIPKQTAIDKIGGIFCHICNSTFGNKKQFESHYAQHRNEKIVYTCVVCKKQIASYPSFRGHCYLNHVVKNKFQCKHCAKTFCKLSVLNTHISTVHDYKCVSCEEKFTSKKDLETHKIIHKMGGKDEPPYGCFSCGKVIPTADVCESHIDDHCETLYPCPICKGVLPNKLEATEHLMIHFDENIPTDISPTLTLSEDSSINILGGILCCHCDLLFRNRTELDSHFAAEHEDKTIVYTCNICGKQYDKYGMFGDHCYLHYSKDRFQCDQCYKTFPRLSLLVIHTEVFHTGCTTDKPYTCENCSHGFMSRQRLKEHMRIVHNELCNIRCMKPGCSATFEKPRDLILHQKDHNAFLDNWCRQCGLQFATLSSAERHLDVHRRKQYSCPVCKRQYRERYLMVKHVPVHFETVLHVCKMCGKAYTARHRLMAHLKTHSDLRSYKCTFCSKAFIKPHELKQHLNIHADQKPYLCTHCPKAFTNYPNWSKHLTRMHDIDKPTVKRLKLARDEAAADEPTPMKTSPMKAESGIESAGSEMSVDLYTFVESDESTTDVKIRQIDWEIPTTNNQIENIETFNTICVPATKETMSISDTVNAVLNRIDSLDDNLDVMACNIEINEFHASNAEMSEFDARHAEINEFQASKADMNEFRASSAEINEFHTTNAEINEFHATNAEISKFHANNAEINEFHANNAEINEFHAHNAEISKFHANNAEINEFHAHNAEINEFHANNADMNEFHASHVEINEFNAVTSDYNAGNIMPQTEDDSSDIQAIVEHIDAMSGEIETVNQADSTVDNLSGLRDVGAGVLQYADLMPVDRSVFNTISDTVQANVHEMSYYQPGAYLPEYGPDFINQGAGVASDGFINLDDHMLPHIDPLLTIRAEENAKMYVQNLNNYNFDDVTPPIDYDPQNGWEPPIITKVYHPYEENNDANRMYIY